MTDLLDEIASINAMIRSSVREQINRGISSDMSPAEIAATVFGQPAKAAEPTMADLKAALIQSLLEPMPTPIVNVQVHPTPVTVAAPVVHISQPDVTVEAAHITVEAAKADLPIVIPAPIINLTTPAELAITSMPTRRTRRTVKRDSSRLITETVDVEDDA